VVIIDSFFYRSAGVQCHQLSDVRLSGHMYVKSWR